MQPMKSTKEVFMQVHIPTPVSATAYHDIVRMQTPPAPMYAAILCDAYKFCHPGLYPKGYKRGRGNFTPRSAHHFRGSKGYDKKIVVANIKLAMSAINHAWNQFFEASWG